MIIDILKGIENFGGVAVLALFAVALIMAIQKGIISKEGFKNITGNENCPDPNEEIKNILQDLVNAISGPKGLKGNDLTHIQMSIDNLGTKVKDLGTNVEKLEEGMVEFNKNFQNHDRQAWEINEGVKEINQKLKTM